MVRHGLSQGGETAGNRHERWERWERCEMARRGGVNDLPLVQMDVPS